MEMVLDCSCALAWAIADENSSAADKILTSIKNDSRLWVPDLYWYELSNALTMAQRRGRLMHSSVGRLIELYTHLPIFTDTLLGAHALHRHMALAQRYNLTTYDAAYLELAERRGLALATLDKALAQAARHAGILTEF